jgi:hypothetical protein
MGFNEISWEFMGVQMTYWDLVGFNSWNLMGLNRN